MNQLLGGNVKKLFGIMTAALLVAAGLLAATIPASSSPAGPGPHSGEFSAWTKVVANGSEIKFYAKYPQLDQKIQFMYQAEDSSYQELAWIRISKSDLNSLGEYENLTNAVYFIRTLNLEPGKNRIKILVDGKQQGESRTYSMK